MRVLPDGRVEEDLTSQIDGQTSDFVLHYDSLIYTVSVLINGVDQGLPGGAFSVPDAVTVRIDQQIFILRSPDQLVVRYRPR